MVELQELPPPPPAEEDVDVHGEMLPEPQDQAAAQEPPAPLDDRAVVAVDNQPAAEEEEPLLQGVMREAEAIFEPRPQLPLPPPALSIEEQADIEVAAITSSILTPRSLRWAGATYAAQRASTLRRCPYCGICRAQLKVDED